MRSLLSKPAALVLIAVLGVMTAACGCPESSSGSESTEGTDAEQPQRADTSAPTPQLRTLPTVMMGVDAYFGASNMSGRSFYSDGMWAASGPAYPSVTYLRWDSPAGDACKLSFGSGDLYTSSEAMCDQPVEAFWQMPAGKTVVTFGKYWVPFAQQEWLYEPKPGIMAQWTGGRMSVAASANYNTELNCPNAYMRAGYKLASDAELGVSFGIGNGFCVNSVHDRGFALDTNIGFGGFRLYGEYNRYAAREPGSVFEFLSGKLYYEKLGALKPFLASFSWDDASEEFGHFRSTVFGLDYQLSPTLGIQGAFSTTSDSPVSWLQLHWAYEKALDR